MYMLMSYLHIAVNYIENQITGKYCFYLNSLVIGWGSCLHCYRMYILFVMI